MHGENDLTLFEYSNIKTQTDQLGWPVCVFLIFLLGRKRLSYSFLNSAKILSAVAFISSSESLMW